VRFALLACCWPIRYGRQGHVGPQPFEGVGCIRQQGNVRTVLAVAGNHGRHLGFKIAAA